MKVIKEVQEDTYSDLYPDKYEFRLCGGSVEPEEEDDDKNKEEE